MLERFIQNKKLDTAKLSAKKLLSARGEANAQSMAIKLIDHYEHLDKRSQIDFFQFLSGQFNPDPALVMDAANRLSHAPAGARSEDTPKVVSTWHP